MYVVGVFIFMFALSSLPSFFVGDEGNICFRGMFNRRTIWLQTHAFFLVVL